MSREIRKKLIAELEKSRDRRVVCYVTGDRPPNLATQIAPDVFPLMHDLLNKIGHVKQLDLYIYSIGGMTMVAWGLINLLREYCDHLSVLVPFRALSTATLIALGANEIVMSRLAQLSPVDPSVNTPYNPPSPPQQPGAPPLPPFLPVSVEDVRGFLDLAREEAKITDQNLISSVFSQLATDVRPLALGNVHRATQQIKKLTEKLLRLHLNDDEKGRIDPIIDVLTRTLFSHDYIIQRREAKEIIGREVVDPTENAEKAMMALHAAYADDLELNKPYNAEWELGKESQKTLSLQRAYVESKDGCFVFRTVQEIRLVKIPQNPQLQGINVKVIGEGWTPDAV
jgi:hypothetical protein